SSDLLGPTALYCEGMVNFENASGNEYTDNVLAYLDGGFQSVVLLTEVLHLRFRHGGKFFCIDLIRLFSLDHRSGNKQPASNIDDCFLQPAEELYTALQKVRLFAIDEHRQHSVDLLPLITEQISNGWISNIFYWQVVNLPLDDLGINGHVPVMKYR